MQRDVSHRVIIEAMDEAHAEALFESFPYHHSGDCSCCGDRWSGCEELNLDKLKKCYKDETFSTIEDYLQFIVNKWGWFKGETPDAILHYFNGTKRKFYRAKQRCHLLTFTAPWLHFYF